MEGQVLALGGSPWLLLAVWALAALDGIFPPVPSETVVLAAAVLSASTGRPSLLQLVPAAAFGAFCGDLIAYSVGRRVPLRRLRIFRSSRAQRSLDWAERALRSRGTSFILSARFVPVGRVAVNMTAGATGFPLRRFVPTAALAGAVWASYTTALGVGAGSFLADRPLVAIAVGIGIGSLVGAFIDAAVGRRAARTTSRTAGEPAGVAPAADGLGVDGPVADGLGVAGPGSRLPHDRRGARVPADRARGRLGEGVE
jgi:membrane-associated protein